MDSKIKNTYCMNNDVENILFHIKHNIIPKQLDDVYIYFDLYWFVKDTTDKLYEQLEPLIKGLVKQSYKEGFKQGQEFEKTQPNGFN